MTDLHWNNFEANLRLEAYQRVAGVDEAGRGPLAGPLVAAAVIFTREPGIEGVNDSKLLSPEQRENLFEVIVSSASAWGIGLLEPEALARLNNMHLATFQAMRLALAHLQLKPDFVLVDGKFCIPDLDCAQKAFIKGDRKIFSIAAASILAKVTRDRIMRQLDPVYPGYGFALHKGYGTPQHLEALYRLGPCPAHRANFYPVRHSKHCRGEADGQLLLDCGKPS